MATLSEIRLEQAMAALEAASRLYEGKDGDRMHYTSSVIATADQFLDWLKKRS